MKTQNQKSSKSKTVTGRKAKTPRHVVSKSTDGEIVEYSDGSMDFSGKTLAGLKAIAKKDGKTMEEALSSLFIEDAAPMDAPVHQRSHVALRGSRVQLSQEVMRAIGGADSEEAQMRVDSAILGMLLTRSKPVNNRVAMVPIAGPCHLAKFAGLMEKLEPGITLAEVVFALADHCASEAIEDPELIILKIRQIQFNTKLRRLDRRIGAAKVLAARKAAAATSVLAPAKGGVK